MSLEDELLKFAQPLPEDANQLQLVLRTLSRPVTPTILKAGEAQDLVLGDLSFVTDFEGPWKCGIVAVKFTKVVDGVEVPNTDAKDFVISMILGGEEFPLVERFNYRGTGATLTDKNNFGPGDQVKIWCRGADGTATVQVRGEKL